MSDYLYTVALVAVTYVGFSTVFVTVGEALRDTMSKYDFLLIKNMLYLGIIVILGCLLPSLVRLLGAQPWVVVRLPSLATAVPVAVFCILYPRARRRATDGPMPARVLLDMGLVYAAGLVLLANAGGVLLPSSVGVHAIGVTILLVAVLLAFPFGLDLLPQEPAKPVEGDGVDTEHQRETTRRAERSAARR